MTEAPFGINPVDYINFFYPFKDIFRGDKVVHMKSDTEACYHNPEDIEDDINKTTFQLSIVNGTVAVMKANPFKLTSGDVISKFMLLTAVKFKGNYRAAESFVMYSVMKLEIPYVRVGTDYYKIIEKENRYGGTDRTLKAWGKEVISDDHTKTILKLIPKFDDFCLVPDNINYQPVHKNCYNQYAEFPHTPHSKPISESQIPHSIKVMKHIFGEQFDRGLIYMKVLYEHPKQMMPVIVLVSKERGTGKTTFLNWLQMIFSDNLVMVDPHNLSSQFNYIYASKNIIMVDETIVEKTAAEQKIKSITTAKTMSVNPKHVQGYSLPFFGKIIMCTNKVKDFMRIDKEENRFWIRYIKPVTGRKHIKIEDDLFAEIPKFIRYITQLPAVDFTRDRLVFTMDQIITKELIAVKEESQSWMVKELLLHITDFFNNNGCEEFYAAAIDIKNEWFARDNQVKASYISKVLKNEMEYVVQKNQRYIPFNKDELGKERVSTPFKFERNVEKVK